MGGITASARLTAMCLAAGASLLAGSGSGTRAVVVRVERNASRPVEAGTRVEVVLRGRNSEEAGGRAVRLEGVYVSRVRGADPSTEEIEVDLTPEQEALVKRARVIQLASPRGSSAARTAKATAPETRLASADTAPARTEAARRGELARPAARSAAAGPQAPARAAEVTNAEKPGLVETYVSGRTQQGVVGGLLKYLLLPGAAILALYGGIFGLQRSRTRHRGYRRNRRKSGRLQRARAWPVTEKKR